MSKPLSIAIAGAGIMGLISAYMLRREGHSVRIYERKTLPAQNASFIAGGMLAPYSEIEHMNGRWIEAGLMGIEIWSQFDQADIGFAQNGSFLIAHDEDQHMLERFKVHLPSNSFSRVSTEKLEPKISSKFSEGLFLAQEAHLDPRKTMDFLSAKDFDCVNQVADIQELSKQYDWVIDCRGLSAADPELRGVKGEILMVRNSEFSLARPVRLMHPRYPLYIVPRQNNVFVVGATLIEAEDEQVSVRSGLELLSALYSLHPSFAEAEILELRAGLRPSYPDNLPRIKIDENIISCNGLFRHGYLLAPVMAVCVQQFIDKKKHEFLDLFIGDKGHEDNNQRTKKDLRKAS